MYANISYIHLYKPCYVNATFLQWYYSTYYHTILIRYYMIAIFLQSIFLMISPGIECEEIDFPHTLALVLVVVD